jgi:hypothetical protein
VQPYVDAAHQCLRGDPLPTHAGLTNHQSENPTCSADWARSALCTLPVMVLRSRNTLRGGSELTYNYDSHLRDGAYTFGPQAAADYMARCIPCFPCRCADPAPCPRNRFFP